MAVAARDLESVHGMYERQTMPPPGFVSLFEQIIGRFGAGVLDGASMESSFEIGPESGVFLLTVAPERVDEASTFSAELSVEVQERFGERYTVIVATADEEEAH